MNISGEQITNMVIKWLDKHDYSKDHWKQVAKEMLEKNHNDKELAVLDLAKALESFHQMYKSKVVRSDNLLDEILTTCFDMVDWKQVAESRL